MRRTGLVSSLVGSQLAVCGVAAGDGIRTESMKIPLPEGVYYAGIEFEAIAAHGATAVIGHNPTEPGILFDSGVAYVIDLTTGERTATLAASDAEVGDLFGWSVAVTGSKAVISAPMKAPGGGVYVFDLTTGEELRRLQPEAQDWNGFGVSVAAFGTKAAVASWYLSQNDVTQAVLIFDLETGEQIARLDAPSGVERSFGWSSIAMSETTAAVPSPQGVLLYDLPSGDLLTTLVPDDPGASPAFARSVAISDTTVLVGSPDSAAYLFDAVTGEQRAKISETEDTFFDDYGESVALSGNIAAVSAPRVGSGLFTDEGAVFLYNAETGEPVGKLLASDADTYTWLGASLALAGSKAIVGALGGSGSDPAAIAWDPAVFVFDLSCPADLAAPLFVHDLGDIVSFVTAFTSGDPVADLDENGVYEFADVEAFLAAFDAGCL